MSEGSIDGGDVCGREAAFSVLWPRLEVEYSAFNPQNIIIFDDYVVLF